MSPTIILTIEAGIAILQVNRPEVHNALNWEAQAAFADAIQRISNNQAVRVLIITGSGSKAFVAGGDLSQLVQDPTLETGIRLHETMTRALHQLSQLSVPTIAAINGLSVGGGCEILTACDLRMASDLAVLRFGQVKVGLSTGWGGGYRLVQLLGRSRAIELLLTGRSLSAAEAQTIGFVHRVVPDQELQKEARQWAAELASLPAKALAGLKQVALSAGHNNIQTAREVERDTFLSLFGGPDNREAMAAFQERRSPQFNQAGPTQ